MDGIIGFFNGLTQWVTDFNSFLWGTMFLIPLLVGTGIFYTFRLKFVQVRKFPLAMRYLCGGATLFGKRADKTGMSSFQALTTAIAAQVGTGNVAGTATALVMGGPGAVFWLWCAAFFGMATIFAEAVLAQVYKTADKDGHVVGGPAYYMTRGMGPKAKPLAVFFAIAIIIALGCIGNMVQSNTIAVAFNSAFSLSQWVMGIVVCILAFLVFVGGMGRIAAVTEKLVPAMAILYIIGGTYVLIVNGGNLGHAFSMIFEAAFSPEAVFGGGVGIAISHAMRYGVARGLFANEAGMGSTPHAHAVAKVEHPCQQGLVAIFGVFTVFVIVTFTALVILVSGVFKPNDNAPLSAGIRQIERAQQASDVTALAAAFGSLEPSLAHFGDSKALAPAFEKVQATLKGMAGIEALSADMTGIQQNLQKNDSGALADAFTQLQNKINAADKAQVMAGDLAKLLQGIKEIDQAKLFMAQISSIQDMIKGGADYKAVEPEVTPLVKSLNAYAQEVKRPTGIALTQMAYAVNMGGFGGMFVGICLFFFAFSTIVGWYFFGAQNVRYLFHSEGAVSVYRIVVVCFVFLGSCLEVELVWQLADLFNGLMVVPNLIALWALNKVVARHLNEFDGLMNGTLKPADIKPDTIYGPNGAEQVVTPVIARSPEQYMGDRAG